MSLEYRSEEEPAPEETADDATQYRRATAVFPLYTAISIAAVVAVFICELTARIPSSDLDSIDASVLLAGFVKQLFSAGQYWRILTGAALHAGIAHLFFNSYALYSLGRLIETLSNRAHLAIVFLLSAIGGGVLSLIFLPESPSVGASGGIVGLLGYLAVYGYKRRKLLPEGFLKSMLFNIGFIAFFGIGMNVWAQSNPSKNLPMVDNFGHLGGLIVGAIYGFVQIPADLYKDPRETNLVTRIFGLAALAVFVLTCVFSILLLLGIISIPFPAIPELMS